MRAPANPSGILPVRSSLSSWEPARWSLHSVGNSLLRRALGQDSSRLNPNSLILPQILAVAGFFTGAASRGWMGRWGMILSLLGAAVWVTIVFGPRIMG